MALTKLLIQTLNFKDLVDEIMEEFPCGYGDVVKLFYFCADSKSNIQIHLDQDYGQEISTLHRQKLTMSPLI